VQIEDQRGRFLRGGNWTERDKNREEKSKDSIGLTSPKAS